MMTAHEPTRIIHGGMPIVYQPRRREWRRARAAPSGAYVLLPTREARGLLCGVPGGTLSRADGNLCALSLSSSPPFPPSPL